jgi:diguanylate cyclase (GGDEF)-like protein/PAS domain S-box-containing protein
LSLSFDVPIQLGRGKPVPASESNPPQTPTAPAATYLIDWNPQEDFKDLLKLAASICEVRDGSINLLDEESKPFKVYVGQSVVEVPLDSWFCSHTIRQCDLLMVPDLRDDPRFCDSLFVTGEPYLRFYAGCPLIASNGGAVGSLCIYDFAPRHLTAMQQQTLSVLARQISTHIELKKQTIVLHTAVEELNRMAHELEISDSRFRAFMDASPMAAFIKNEEGRMVYCNRALSDRFGAIPEDWIGKTDFEVWPREMAEKFHNQDLPVLEQNRAIHYEDHTLGPDGRTVAWDVHKYPLVDASGGRSVACAALDVTKEREAEQEVQQVQQELQVLNERLRTLSLTDALTGLMNRRALEDCLERELARCIRSRAQLCLLMLDVDHFKSFNDSFGHVQGDEALRRISALMQKWTRKGDLVARYGGEEFLAILPDTRAVEAIRIAKRLCEAVAAAAWEHRVITASIGVATLDERTLSTTSFLDEADQALYAAKRRGRNQVCAAQSNPGNTTLFVTPEKTEGGLQ